MLNKMEIAAFLKLFDRNGYVLDFSTNSFNIFTMESVGVALCEKYGLSKGKSLSAFCEEADMNDIIKLLSDLLQYYEIHRLGGLGEDSNRVLYEKCKIIMDRELQDVRIEAPAIVSVNREYIVDISSRANRDIEQGDYDSAITKARTLVEEVLCHAIEAKGESPSATGQISKLYKQVKDLYNMHIDNDMDTKVKTLLSGLEKIITAIGDMRNIAGDAHGLGGKRFIVREHHARLFANAAVTMAEFILSVENNKKE